MMRSLGTELSPDGVRVNAVYPGFVHTEMTQPNLNAGQGGEFRKKTAIDRLGGPESFVDLVRFLLSDRAAFISGETILTDAGQVALG